MSVDKSGADTLLVLGASGTLGSAVVDAAREARTFATLAACGFRRAPAGDVNFQFDVLDETELNTLPDKLAKAGKTVSAIVHCIGATRDALLPQISDSDWDAVMDLNLQSAFRITRAFLPTFASQRRGQFIFIGSHSGRLGRAGQSAYSAAKAGLVGLAQTIAREYGKRKVQANVVLPGFLEDSPMVQAMDPETLARLRSENVLGSPTTAAEAARFILHLLSMHHVSGQVFALDSRILPQS